MSLKLKIPASSVRAAITANSYNAADHTIEVVFATEYEVQRRTWDGTKFIEILDCNTAAVRLDRLNSGANLVDTHNIYTVKTILGVVTRAWVEGKQCKAVIRLSKRDDVKGTVDDIIDGIISNISVGYNIFGATQIDRDDEVIQVRITDWEPFELSVLSAPADPNAGVRSQNNEDNFYELNISSNKRSMTPEEKAARDAERKRISEINSAYRAAGISNAAFLENLINGDTTAEAARGLIEAEKLRIATPPAPLTPTPPAPAPVDAAAIQAAERTRITEITNTARWLNIDDEEFVSGLITRGVSVPDANQQFVTRMAQNQPNITGHNPGPGRITADEADNRRRGMSLAIEHRVNPSVKLENGAADFRGMTMLDMARFCIEAAGGNTRGMSRREIAEAALNCGTRAVGMNSTSDFPVILGNTVNRVLRQEYDLQTRTFTEWANRGTARDFRTMTKVSLGEVGDFKEVKEGGEYEYTTLGESGESYKVVKYGQIIAYTWEMMINDDLDAFSRIPRKIAAAAARKQSDIVYGILTSNPNMADNVALFHATHKNLATAAAIGIDPMGKMRQLMRVQKGIDSKDFLNLTPQYLITGPSNEQLALQYTSTQFTANVAGSVNVWAGLVKPIIEPRITDTSWFFAASPNAIDTIEYSFLEGEGELFTEQRQGFEVDGVEIKARMVFGAKAIDWRGLAKNPGV